MAKVNEVRDLEVDLVDVIDEDGCDCDHFS